MRLVLCGGGTGGHIIPNVALIQELREQNPKENHLEMLYFGTATGMERKLMEQLEVPYQVITCGKLRRYFSWENFLDLLKIPVGVVQSFFALRRFRPEVIFCKGGYSSFPVAIAGWVLKIPVILHESDFSPGLANRLCARFAKIICISFPESRKFFKGKKVVFTGNPVRRELAFGNKEDGLKFTDFDKDIPTLFCMGGSQGAGAINTMVFENFDYLLKHYQVVHVCGKDKIKSAEELLKFLQPENQKFLSNYRSFEFVGSELKDLYALADVIVSRAGAISLAEIGFFNKPALLIPLPNTSSRGDQIENAEYFSKDHPCRILEEKNFTFEQFHEDLKYLFSLKVEKDLKVDPFAALQKIIQLLKCPCE